MVRRPYSALILALILVSCGKPAVNVSIPFAAQFNGATIDCSRPHSGVSLTDLRLYVHDIQLLDVDGAAQSIVLDVTRWQQGDLAQLDLEDGTGQCLNSTSETNTALLGTIPAGDYRGLRFVVGVPFERNHADPLSAAAPLGDTAMHWHWRAGYKFLRAGVNTETDEFWLHLGSAGCVGTVRDISSCRYPNRVAVELPDFVPNRDAVVIDLSALFAAINVDDLDTGNCSSGPAEASCVAPFAALGIDHGTGQPGLEQRVFLQKAAR